MKLPGLRSRTVKGLRRVAAYWKAQSELERLAATHYGQVVNKLWHYYEIYERHFARFRDRDITLLEIGVAAGGSLELWRRYFGQRARSIGIDINPDCARLQMGRTYVRIGSQDDAAFLAQVVDEFGPFDIVIDDGSHASAHQLGELPRFVHIREDGIYSREDLCTSYRQAEFDGGVSKPGTLVEFLKGLIDELNAWYWREDIDGDDEAFAKSVHGLHFYPALVVIEKRAMTRPILSPVGIREKRRDQH